MGGEVMSMRTVVGLVTFGLLLAGCGTPQQGPQAGTGSKLYEAVWLDGGQYVSVIDSRSHAIERRLPMGTPANDWKHLYSILGSSLIDTDPMTGDTLNTLLLHGAFNLPAATSTGLPGGLSPAGRWLVVQGHDVTGTHMLLIDTRTFMATDRIELPGRFNFDAISDDGQRLYLIQYLNGREYYVRLFDTVTNQLDANIVVDKADGSQAMQGLRLSGIATPGGGMLFSMYVRQNDGPFIHALNLSGPFAFCLDLPGGGYTQGRSEMQWSLAMNSSGSKLYAINGATGVVAEVDTTSQYNPHVLRTAHIGTLGSGAVGSGASVLTPDGNALVTAGSSGLLWVDTSTLKVRMESLSEWHISSLALSPDGKTLYAMTDVGQVAQVSAASGEVTSRFDPAAGRPIALMRVAAA
jgi:hypothetical protein